MDFAVEFKTIKDRDAFLAIMKTANVFSTYLFNPKTKNQDSNDKKNLAVAFDTWISVSRWLLKAAKEKCNGEILEEQFKFVRSNDG